MKFIIAKHNENIDWAKDLDHVVVQKGVDLPNLGREASSYVYYILKNYQTLSGEYVFCQGKPFDHVPNFLEEIKTKRFVGVEHTSDRNGSPSHPGIRVGYFADALHINRDSFSFVAGAQFRVSAEDIYKHSYVYYAKLFTLSFEPDAPWALERLWRYIFE